MFAHHITIETKGNISLIFLKKESEQYKRCRQAVKDNIIMSTIKTILGFDGINILRVIKVNHEIILKNWQVIIIVYNINIEKYIVF